MYRQPQRIDDALAVLSATPCTVLAGGTDVYPANVGRPLPASLLDISRIDALRGIATDAAGGWRIGALTTWSQLLHAELPAALAVLRQVAREVGGVQIQNQATVGGNLCNASPAADGTPALLALDASVELLSAHGRRELAIDEFVLANRRTARRADELLTAVTVPPQPPNARSCFLKLGHRRYLVISIASVALRLEPDEHARVRRCAIAVGACAPAPRRLRDLERALEGSALGSVAADARRLLDAGADAWLAPLSPIDDVRGTAGYRLDAVRSMIVRGLAELSS